MRTKRTGYAAAVFLMVATWMMPDVLSAQSAAPGGDAGKPAAMAKDADLDWEVTTVKPSDPNETKDYMYMQGRHLIVHNEPVENMLRLAYSVQNNQIVGAPDWMKTERYDVDAVLDVDRQLDTEQFHSLVRKLLEERCGLKVHLGQREMPVYALTVAKSGPKMEKSAGDPNGGPHRKVNAGGGQIGNEFTNTSMPDLALMLLLQVDRPIVDQTGLKGRYDFKLQWTMDEVNATAPDAPPGLFTAMQEQLGLKLEPVKAPADVLVVDKVERPGAN